jgi:uncharacterized protein (TIGR02246 family)
MQANAKIQDLAKRYAAAWCSQDPTKVAGCYSLSGSLTINNGAPAIGRLAIAREAQSFMTDFPDMQVLMDDLRVQPDGIEFRWTLIGTNTGPGGTGHRVRIGGFEIWRLGPDGLIATSSGQFDSAEYNRQLQHGAREQQ